MGLIIPTLYSCCEDQMRLPVKRSPQSQDWDLISSQLRLTVIAVVFVNTHLPPKSLSCVVWLQDWQWVSCRHILYIYQGHHLRDTPCAPHTDTLGKHTLPCGGPPHPCPSQLQELLVSFLSLDLSVLDILCKWNPMWNVSFCVWLLSLSIICFQVICTSFFLLLTNTPLCGKTTFYTFISWWTFGLFLPFVYYE